MSTNFSDLFELEVAEKLQLVEDLWDNIAATPEAVPVEDWQKEELARRNERMVVATMERRARGQNPPDSSYEGDIYDAISEQLRIDFDRLSQGDLQSCDHPAEQMTLEEFARLNHDAYEAEIRSRYAPETDPPMTDYRAMLAEGREKKFDVEKFAEEFNRAEPVTPPPPPVDQPWTDYGPILARLEKSDPITIKPEPIRRHVWGHLGRFVPFETA